MRFPHFFGTIHIWGSLPSGKRLHNHAINGTIHYNGDFP